MDCSIVFEDASLLVLNKPPGMVVNRAETVKEATVQDWLETHVDGFAHLQTDPTNPDFSLRTGTVHRIDKETSGLLLVAKTVQVFSELQRQFKERLVHKTYRTFVHGKLVPQEGEINAPIGRLPWNREQFGIIPGGKDSLTRYRTLEFRLFTAPTGEAVPFTVVDVFPETGRTHQIRVHMKYLGHPLIGDYLYAGRKTSRDDRIWAPRVMLHAHKLTCLHPVTGASFSVEAEIPSDMTYLIQSSVHTT